VEPVKVKDDAARSAVYRLLDATQDGATVVEPGCRRLLVIDSETCGWGVPAVDLAPARYTDPPHVDLNAYCRVVPEPPYR
jgi:hypothetical protein